MCDCIWIRMCSKAMQFAIKSNFQCRAALCFFHTAFYCLMHTAFFALGLLQNLSSTYLSIPRVPCKYSHPNSPLIYFKIEAKVRMKIWAQLKMVPLFFSFRSTLHLISVKITLKNNVIWNFWKIVCFSLNLNYLKYLEQRQMYRCTSLHKHLLNVNFYYSFWNVQGVVELHVLNCQYFYNEKRFGL